MPGAAWDNAVSGEGRGAHVMGEPVCAVLRHTAFFYPRQREYGAGIVAFVRAGLAAGGAALLALPGGKAPGIGDRLYDAPGQGGLTDMAELVRTRARINPELRAFPDKHPGQRVRYAGEPIWPGRSAAEICEATRHEALVNLAFAQAPIALLCPYDASGLTGSVLTGARRTHQEPAATGATRHTWPDNLPPAPDR